MKISSWLVLNLNFVIKILTLFVYPQFKNSKIIDTPDAKPGFSCIKFFSGKWQRPRDFNVFWPPEYESDFSFAYDPANFFIIAIFLFFIER